MPAFVTNESNNRNFLCHPLYLLYKSYAFIILFKYTGCPKKSNHTLTWNNSKTKIYKWIKQPLCLMCSLKTLDRGFQK